MNRDGLHFTPVSTLPTLRPGMVLYIDRDGACWHHAGVNYDPHVCWWSRQVMALWFAVPYMNALAFGLWLDVRRGQQRALFEIEEAA